MTGADLQRLRRARARELGLCGVCCVRKPDTGNKCTGCRMAQARAIRALRARAVAAGMCTTCRCRPMAPESKYCAWCLGAYQRRRMPRWCDDCLAFGHRGSCARRAA